MYAKRYIFDALYGPVSMPQYVWEILPSPELQRLREVRLCNVNSLCLTGGANVNRYEHSVGAAYLATQCIENWPTKLSQDVKRQIVLATLLHDIGTAPFGHSVQYVLDLAGYEHESLYDMVVSSNHGTAGKYEYQHARIEPIYFGTPRRLAAVLAPEDLKCISEIVAGRGPYGPLVNGTVDLDNLDNVFRLAYHIGLVRSGEVPLVLAQSLRLQSGALTIKDDAVPALQEWYDVRRKLYEYLLLNPDEFAAKCMLQEALELARSESTVSFEWHDVDFELVKKLANCSDEVAAIVSRIMLGDLYGCVGVFSSSNVDAYALLNNPESRNKLEKDLGLRVRHLGMSALKSAAIALHVIKDVNKTQRQITVRTTSGRQITVGTPTHQLLVGVFFKNVHLGMTAITEESLNQRGIPGVVKRWLEEVLVDQGLLQLTPYAEISAYKS
jgi:uncharacterized protein